MKRRDMKLLLEERFERIALLETRIDTMDQLVEGYRAREQAIFDTLQTAKESAAKIIEQAQSERAQLREEAEAESARVHAEAEAKLQEAEEFRLKARAEAEAVLADAINTANALKKEAERQGVELNATVKADSERMLRDAEIIKREYEEMVDSFNAMLEQNASELEITAARFAEFVKNRKIDRSEVRLDGNAFYKSVGELSDANLPDASGDPALLMQNIYRIQNRPLPEDRLEVAAQEEPAQPANKQEAKEASPDFPMQDGSGADERVAEPFSEAAWINEDQQSEAEPQAEFTKAFDDAFAPSEYTVQSEACNVTPEDVESAFDALLTGETASKAEELPLASAISAAALSTEPLDDVSRALDEYLDTTLEPSGKQAQDEVGQEQQQGPQGNLPTQESADVCINQPAEPYSEQAWQQSTFTSELEPQAEGALFADISEVVDQPVCAVTPPAPQEAEQVNTVSGDDIDTALDDYLAQLAPSPRYKRPTEEQPEPTEPEADHEAVSAFDDYLAALSFSAPATAQEPVAAPEPYSEDAWKNNALSALEPQAEGTLFGEMSDFTVEPVRAEQPDSPSETEPPRPVAEVDVESAMNDYFAQVQAFAAPMPHVPVAPAPREPASAEPATDRDAESALDEYLKGIGTFSPVQGADESSAPEPYSERAWQHSAFTSELEPQAEGALFDTGKEAFQAQAGSSYDAAGSDDTITTSTAASAFDEYMTGIGTFSPEPSVDESSAPEPYSERAWQHSAFTSELEPQAEGAPSLYTEEPEEEQQPTPRKYNEYGEIREWEPEREPEMEDVPTVSRFMGQNNSDEISLDDLLDEIIKAGD